MTAVNDTLTVRSGMRTWTVRAGTIATIGRDGDLVLDNPTVSRVHATVYFDSGWWIRDEGSAGGLWADGKRERIVRLGGEKLIHLGDPSSGAPALVFSPLLDTGIGAPTPFGRMDADSPGRAPRGEVAIGRAAENDVALSDLLVSRRHCVIVADESGLRVRDLGSRNGTFLDGERVSGTVECPDGALLTVGNTDFRVSMDGGLPVVEPAVEGPGLRLERVAYHAGTGRKARALLHEVGIEAPHGRFMAVIGPTGAGKSTLMSILTGQKSPSKGRATFDGMDIAANFDALRTRIGFVPQEDIIHRTLQLQDALDFAAQLRLPPDVTAEERGKRVRTVLEELGLSQQARTSIARLSGGQRKRASVALELLTEPAMLILDEPTSGLDPDMDRQVMALLRRIADSGRIVVVVTHRPESIGVCDYLLVLARGGSPAYTGRPQEALQYFGVDEWDKAFGLAANQADDLLERYLATEASRPVPPASGPFKSKRAPSVSPPLRQYRALISRQLRLMTADVGYSVFLAALPVVLGFLALIVPGDAGFGVPAPARIGEPSQLLVLLVVGAAVTGMALTVRDLVGEREIFRREAAAGLRPLIYLLAKLTVAAALCFVQSAVMVAILLSRKPEPVHHILSPIAGVDLWIAVSLTAIASAALGLAASAWAKSSEQVMPILAVGIMAQLVLAGGLIPVTGRQGLEQLSALIPSRWGFALGAESIDLRSLVPSSEKDWLWEALPERAWLAIGALVIAIIVACAIALVRLIRLPGPAR
ncbi:ATP-binding cassette domain-containing protein [Arthrobacter sp. GN70]|uniref:ATP-binding cassette domain-containing protein n=1 Tax=Arthrobacter terricola TaxID=2547396 RepID=A0A4R5KFB0_9MICC|nr:ATP-binding cassette domain-containing protein [Arthrobacter sp. GN70]MBT8162584.1 ATP-binding cassette domain-containing protein [Arthrobacter sp. GN70]TDF92860.1 ATP-binding cassette domain-containing protein [Arthrobacter terricola]